MREAIEASAALQRRSRLTTCCDSSEFASSVGTAAQPAALMDETQRALEEGIRRGIDSADRGPELTDWLMAVDGAGAFLATLALIVLRCSRCATYTSRPTPPKTGPSAADQVTLYA